MNHEQMAWRCPTAQFIKSVYLRGWRLEFGNHATVVPQRGAVTPGAIWKITPYDLESLDAYEGYPIYYTRRRWRQDGEHFFFYEMQDLQGSPSAPYVEGILQGYQHCGIHEPCYTKTLEQYIKTA
jgi:hypothetical protein